MTEVDYGLEILVSEARPGCGTDIVTHIRVGRRVSFRNVVIGEIQVPVFSTVADIHELSIPIRPHWKLHVKSNASLNVPLHIAMPRCGGCGRLHRGISDRQVRHFHQGRTGRLITGCGRRRTLCAEEQHHQVYEVEHVCSRHSERTGCPS